MNIDEYIKLGLVHEIHVSEIRSFLGCRRRWNWISREHYYPITTPKPLEFGIAYHVGMEVYYNPKTCHEPRHVVAQEAEVAFYNECEAQRKRLGPDLSDEVLNDYQERVALGIGMLNYYFTQIAPKLDKGLKPVKVEIKFKVPIPDPRDQKSALWCRCDECWAKYKYTDELKAKLKECENNYTARESWKYALHDTEGDIREGHFKGLPVVLAGRIDAIFEDEFGRLFAYDWKTASALQDDEEFLLLDLQVAAYMWALHRLNIRVAGFVYHEQRKGYPKPPVELKRHSEGRKYSINKLQETDHATFLKTVANGDNDGWVSGLYDEFLTYLANEGIRFYIRHDPVYKTEAELASIGTNLGELALDMLEIEHPLRLYPSPGRFACRSCAFRQPCIEATRQGDYRYILDSLFEKRPHYYEQQKPSTE